MNNGQRNSATFPGKALKILGLLAFVFLLATPSVAQNSKGDKPTTNPPGPFLRLPKKLFKSKGDDRAYHGDITGRKRIRTKNKSSANPYVYLGRNPYKGRKRTTSDKPAQARGRVFNQPPRENHPAWTGTLQGGPLRVRSISAQRARHNVYPQSGPYVNNQSRKPKQHTRPITRAANGKRVKKRSASHSYVVRGKKDVYWGKFSKGGKPFTGDLTGRKLRTLNFRSSGIGVGTSDTLKFAHRRPRSERARSGRFGGGYVTITGRSRPWLGDLSGQKLRLRRERKSESSGVYELRHMLGSPKRLKGRNNPLPVRRPGVGASGIAKSLRIWGVRRPRKGGGSISGKYNNKGQPINTRAPGIGANGLANYRGKFRQGELGPGIGHQGYGFAGNFKTKRPPKGGGSITGKYNRFNRQPINVRAPGIGADGLANYRGKFRQGDLGPGIGHQGYGFAGTYKIRRPPKGGGSVTGKYNKLNRQPINVRAPGIGADGLANYRGKFRQGDLGPGIGHQGYGYAGNLKTRRPPKGGGSISGKYFKNDGRPVIVRGGAPGFDKPAHFRGNYLRYELQPGFGFQGYGYSGTMKARKPKHGGGSISGKHFNNDGKPINVQVPGDSEVKATRFAGKTSLPWYKRLYVQNPLASKESLKKHKPKPNTYLASGLQVKEKQEAHRRNPHASRNAMAGVGPKDETVKASEYDRAIKMYWSYKRYPHSNKNALIGIKPKGDVKRLVEFSGNSRPKDRRHNPSTHRDALKVLAPGKAYARINDFSGNSKMRKYNDPRMHPDSQFAHGFQDNVKGERTLLMNIKLFWAKLFKKNDTQPEIVKEKEHRPRYDKKEKDLWKALYD